MLLEPAPFQLQLFLTTIQGCIDLNFALRLAVGGNDLSEEMLVEARNGLRGASAAGVSSKVPPGLLERFRTLPYRMAEALEKPKGTLDLFATLSAIDALVDCCALSYASDDVGTVWMGMESWLRKLSDRFKQMIYHRSPAALVVLAHWSLLVQRAGHHCWLLRSSAAMVLREIVGKLPKDSAIQSLVKNLMG
jgi:hypothetical protein